MYFGTKSYLKSTRNHTAKHALGRVWTDNETIQKHILVHKLSAVGFVQNKHRNKHRNKDWSYEQFDIIKKNSLSAKHRGERIKCRFIWQRPRIIYTNTTSAENKKRDAQ
jgi:hypothetical protein